MRLFCGGKHKSVEILCCFLFVGKSRSMYAIWIIINYNLILFFRIDFLLSSLKNKKKIKCVTKAREGDGEDLWLPSMSVPQIIIYLFLIYAIALNTKLCKIDINLSRWEHANYAEVGKTLKILSSWTDSRFIIEAMSDALKTKQIWHKFPKPNLKAKIMIWKMRETQTKANLREKLSNCAKSNLNNFKREKREWKWRAMNFRCFATVMMRSI